LFARPTSTRRPEDGQGFESAIDIDKGLSMKYLVEIDRPNPGFPMTNEAARTFMDSVILPTLGRGEQLAAEGVILAGGPVAGRIALRFIVDVESAAQLDDMLTSIPLWGVAETRVTPLIEFSDRRAHVLTLLRHVTPDGT
jgi:muconolactone delta-isomerase